MDMIILLAIIFISYTSLNIFKYVVNTNAKVDKIMKHLDIEEDIFDEELKEDENDK